MPPEQIALGVLVCVVLLLGAVVGIFLLGRSHLVPKVEALEALLASEAARADKAEEAASKRSSGARGDAGRMADRAGAADADGVLDAAYGSGPDPAPGEPGQAGNPDGTGSNAG